MQVPIHLYKADASSIGISGYSLSLDELGAGKFHHTYWAVHQ